jgi:hypothetical protein
MTTGLDVLTTNGIHFDPSIPITGSSASPTSACSRPQGRAVLERSHQPGHSARVAEHLYWAVFDPSVKGRMWAAVSGVHDLHRPKMWRNRDVKTFRGGVVASDDGGRTWKPSVEGMEQIAATHILLDPGSPAESRTLYVCGFGKGVYKSTDGGHRWVLKNNGLEGSEPFAWRITPDGKGGLYLLVVRRGTDGGIGTPLDGAIYRSSDGAEHWARMPLPQGVNGPSGLAIDPQDPGRLYLAAWAGHGKARGAASSLDRCRQDVEEPARQGPAHFRRHAGCKEAQRPLCNRLRILRLEVRQSRRKLDSPERL